MTCQCLNPGFCPTLSREMVGRLHQLCRTREDYRRLFRRQAGLPEMDPGSTTKLIECGHASNCTGHISTPLGLLPILDCKLHGEVTTAQCESCPDRCEERRPSLGGILTIIGKGPRISSWAVGMVTAPRKEPTLAESMRSLIAAGWDAPRIFAEPSTDIPVDLRDVCPVTQRDTVANAWGNWYLALHELLTRHPNADAYMVAQDDVIFTAGDGAQNLREYLEAALWPDDDPGVVSIYCSGAYARPDHGWFELERKWVWGACAFIWPRESLRHFLATTGADWTAQGRNRKVDVAVGIWQAAFHRSAWFCSPSLTQHVGHTSTIWSSGNRAVGRRRAREFVGEML